MAPKINTAESDITYNKIVYNAHCTTNGKVCKHCNTATLKNKATSKETSDWKLRTTIPVLWLAV